MKKNELTVALTLEEMIRLGFSNSDQSLYGNLKDLLEEGTYTNELEEPGALAELWLAIHEEQPKVDYIYQFMMDACMICNAEDIYLIPAIIKFRNQYFALYTTFEVWAWS